MIRMKTYTKVLVEYSSEVDSSDDKYKWNNSKISLILNLQGNKYDLLFRVGTYLSNSRR